MKVAYDKSGRKIYKFSHSVHQGGYLYCHRVVDNSVITNKDGLKNALKAIAMKFGFLDPTVKVYDRIMFLFFFPRLTTSPKDIIAAIQKNISSFAQWDDEYLWTGAYDLQEKFLKKDLERFGFDYDKG
ncbi:MAG: hypothetical protein ABIF10_01150 [Candidatus Woesearchaeota archaeon]